MKIVIIIIITLIVFGLAIFAEKKMAQDENDWGEG